MDLLIRPADWTIGSVVGPVIGPADWTGGCTSDWAGDWTGDSTGLKLACEQDTDVAGEKRLLSKAACDANKILQLLIVFVVLLLYRSFAPPPSSPCFACIDWRHFARWPIIEKKIIKH